MILNQCIARPLLYPAPQLQVPEAPRGIEEVTVTFDELQVVSWLKRAEQSDAPVILFFHGNGENLASLHGYGQFEEFSKRLDCHFWAIDYPGYGRSQGSPSEETLVGSGLAWVQKARETFTEQPLVVVGWSLGAAVSSQVVAQSKTKVDGLVLISAWHDLHSLASEHFPGFLVSLLLSDKYESYRAAASIPLNTLLIHGAHDNIIPHSQGQRLAGAFASNKFVTINNAGHNDIFSRENVWQEISAKISEIRAVAK